MRLSVRCRCQLMLRTPDDFRAKRPRLAILSEPRVMRSTYEASRRDGDRPGRVERKAEAVPCHPAVPPMATIRPLSTYSPHFTDLLARYLSQHQARFGGPNAERYVDVHLSGPSSRLEQFRRTTLPELESRIGGLAGRTVLDYGCGTGATMVALSLAGATVTGFDVDEDAVEVASARLAEHGFERPVHAGPDTDHAGTSAAGTELDDQQFDFVLMNAVIEHVPASHNGARTSALGDAWSRVAPGGVLAICQTPNRLWPKDIYATGLWWLPWTKSGSSFAYRRAVARGRQQHTDGGPEMLERRGAWGVTYREVLRALRLSSPAEAEPIVMNLDSAQDRWVTLTAPRSSARRIAESIVYWGVRKPFGVPIVALAPMLSPLLFRKPSLGTVAPTNAPSKG